MTVHSVPSVIISGLLVFMTIAVTIVAASTPSYPINSTVLTTADRTVGIVPVPTSSPQLLGHDDIPNYTPYGYGIWQYGPPLSYEKRLDLMPAGYNYNSVTHKERLLHFFTISDIHITDEETPASAIFFGICSTVSSGYSPVMLLSTQVLDAAIQTINAQHLQKPFDFGLSLGDAANDNSYNELRWYIDDIDGQLVDPDSGEMDDPVPGPHNDYQDEFQAAGLNTSVKWYQTLGNHDHFWTGFLPQDDYSRQTLIGLDIINRGNVFLDPAGVNSRGLYMGSINGTTPNGTVFGAGPNSSFPTTPPKVLAADPNRHSLSVSEWMNEFFTTTTLPPGHGFNQSNVSEGFACYSFEPRSDVPIKVIVLDDTQRESDPVDNNSLGYGHGDLDKKRYDWLVNELESGQREGKLMIIAAHIPVGFLPAGQMAGWSSTAYVSQDQLIAKLHTYPNFMLWVAGHLHLNNVSAFPSPDPINHPEYGFWEVQTSSLRDYPQQYRTFEIYLNSDDTVSILVTNVDPAVSEGSLAAMSRSYGVAAQEIFINPLSPMPNGSYNAELVKQVRPPVTVENGGSDSAPSEPITRSITETKTVNVGGGSAVFRAEMTGTDLGKNLVITAMPRSNLPTNMAPPPTTVYQYLSITSSTITGVVNQTALDFSVPQSWLTEHGFTMGDIVMMRNVDGQWQTLDTYFVSEKGGNVFYRAFTTGFSYFAIAYQKGGTNMTSFTPVPTTLAMVGAPVTVSPSPVPITPKETQTVPPAPVASPEEGTPLTIIIVGVVGVIAIITGAFLVRRWWIRRQSPVLFREYD